jgi:chromosome segregation ATPase
MERELENVDIVRNEDDSKITELQYELDILKRNYNMEIEGFGATLQERETCVDTLQLKIDSLNDKLEKAENLIKEYVEKESYFKSKLEESQGLIKYEQMQRQSATDSHINELQQQLEESENHYQLELMNLRAENSNLIELESDLRLKIEELEKSKSQEISATDYEREINNYRTHVESLINQLEAERIEKRHCQDLFEANISEKTFQFNNLLAQIEAERQSQLGILLIILKINV